ncbi:MAG: ATP-binding protein [Spirosomataceae bacterium]
MNLSTTRSLSLAWQYQICLGIMTGIHILGLLIQKYTGSDLVVLILPVSIFFMALFFSMWPVVVTTLLGAFMWNFFFIPPVHSFYIESSEDRILIFFYYIIAIAGIVITQKIREAEEIYREKLDKEKTINLYNTLLNSLSHELRTPIATILGAVDILRDDPSDLAPEQQTLLLEQIEKAGERLNRQVGNLLNMSRLESGGFSVRPEWVEVEDLMRAILRKVNQTYPSRSIVFDLSSGPTYAQLDHSLIEEILYNLLTNAAIYTPESAQIKLSVRFDLSFIEFRVTDDGPGIPIEQLNRIFDKFFRLPKSKPGGTGLGLSIVKGFVEAHNGKITASNREPHGLLVTVQIPTTFTD